MQFIAYREMDAQLLSLLRNQGYEIFYIADGDSNYNEESICQKANGENFVLMTGDEALADRLADNKRIQSGILVLKISEGEAIVRAKIVADALREHAADIPYSYSILTKGNWKSKKLATA